MHPGAFPIAREVKAVRIKAHKQERKSRMKLTLNKISEGEEEIIIRYREMTGRIETVIGILQGTGQRISAEFEGGRAFLAPEEILYLESVDGAVFAYLKDRVCKVAQSLERLSGVYADRGFFRCSKSMVINIYKISYLKSESGNRIRATMENQEEVMISRRYAKRLRQILKGGESREPV